VAVQQHEPSGYGLHHAGSREASRQSGARYAERRGSGGPRRSATRPASRDPSIRLHRSPTSADTWGVKLSWEGQRPLGSKSGAPPDVIAQIAGAANFSVIRRYRPPRALLFSGSIAVAVRREYVHIALQLWGQRGRRVTAVRQKNLFNQIV
jgi:hypothetical protein